MRQLNIMICGEMKTEYQCFLTYNLRYTCNPFSDNKFLKMENIYYV